MVTAFAFIQGRNVGILYKLRGHRLRPSERALRLRPLCLSVSTHIALGATLVGAVNREKGYDQLHPLYPNRVRADL